MEFAMLLANLYIAIKENNLEETKNLIAIFNENKNEYNMDFIPVDFEQLETDNESFNYLLNNLQTTGESAKSFWNYHSGRIVQQFQQKQLNKNDLNDFIQKSLNNTIENYQHLNLLRIAMLADNKDFIVSLKTKMAQEV